MNEGNGSHQKLNFRKIYSRGGNFDRILDFYVDYYGIDVIKDKQTVPSSLLHHYSLKAGNFIVAAIFNENYQFLVLRDPGKHGGWELPGGSVAPGENLEDALFRIVERETGLETDETEPIAVIENHFVDGHREVVHRGLAWLVRARGKIRDSEISLAFVDNFRSVSKNLMYANERILELAQQKLSQKQILLAHDEIDVNRNRRLNYLIHELTVAPLSKVFSSDRIKKIMKNYIGSAKTVLDVSCGDDKFIFEVCKSVELCVANDVSRSVTAALRRERNLPDNIIFTNHDATDLPFSKKFDLVICKNTLHHMHNYEELVVLLDSLKKVGKRVLIVDVEDPSRSTKRARFWNAYYRNFLGDRGGLFMTESEFRDVTSRNFPEWKLQFEKLETVKGNYLFLLASGRSSK